MVESKKEPTHLRREKENMRYLQKICYFLESNESINIWLFAVSLHLHSFACVRDSFDFLLHFETSLKSVLTVHLKRSHIWIWTYSPDVLKHIFCLYHERLLNSLAFETCSSILTYWLIIMILVLQVEFKNLFNQ